MLWAGLIMKDGREGWWPGYERHPGKELEQDDTYEFFFFNVPALPARIAMFNRKVGGRCIGMMPFTSNAPLFRPGDAIAIPWFFKVPIVETKPEYRVKV